MCHCPEVHNGTEWVPHCESLAAGSLQAAMAEGAEPTGWRCPACRGSIVRVYLLPSRLDSRTGNALVPFDDVGQATVRAGYRCRSLVCGWSEWVM